MNDLFIISFPTQDTKECRDVIYLASQFKSFVPAKNVDYDNVLSISPEEFIQKRAIVFRLLEILYMDMTGLKQDPSKQINIEINNRKAIGIQAKFNLAAFLEAVHYDVTKEIVFMNRKN